jgi:demethylmenaquinone methyltransferase/2-methoxy-6-polyprenyl-1,4-benzoquinol methylase
MPKEGKHGVMMKLYEWGHRRFPNYIDCRPIYVREVLEEVNFKIVDTTTMHFWGLPVEIVLAKKEHSDE